MEHDFWLRAWIDGRTTFHQNEYNPVLVETTKNIDLKGKTVFLPLAGKTKDINYFLEKGAKVIANELATKPIDEYFKENSQY